MTFMHKNGSQRTMETCRRSKRWSSSACLAAPASNPIHAAPGHTMAHICTRARLGRMQKAAFLPLLNEHLWLKATQQLVHAPQPDARRCTLRSSTAFSEDDRGGLSLREAAAAARAPPLPPGMPALNLPGAYRGVHALRGSGQNMSFSSTAARISMMAKLGAEQRIVSRMHVAAGPLPCVSQNDYKVIKFCLH